MAIGDDAKAAGYPLVGGGDVIRSGDDEINRSRDFIAQVKALIPVGKAGYRTAAGVTSGTAAPSGGADGDIYFQIL
jgi:hypothetical protein